MNSIDVTTDLLSQIKQKFLEHKVKHALLIGSFAKNEQSIIVQDNHINVLSDIEFFIVLEDTTNIKPLKEDLKILEHQLNYGEQFSIDTDIISEKKARKLRNRFLTYEAKYAGQNIIGDLRSILPEYDISNIDDIDLNLSIFWRVLKLIESDGLSEETKRYVYARNVLDVLSIYLYKRRIGATSYAERLEYIRVNHFDDISLDYKFYKAAFDYKLRPQEEKFDVPLWRIFSEFVNLYTALNQKQPVYFSNKFLDRSFKAIYSTLIKKNMGITGFYHSFRNTHHNLIESLILKIKADVERNNFEIDEYRQHCKIAYRIFPNLRQ